MLQDDKKGRSMKNYDAKRKELKEAGWTRHDRANGPNTSQELWHELTIQGSRGSGVSFAWAWKKHCRDKKVKEG